MTPLWKLWVSGIAGLVVILLPFLGFTILIHKIFLIVLGIIISISSFWVLSETRLHQNLDGQARMRDEIH